MCRIEDINTYQEWLEFTVSKRTVVLTVFELLSSGNSDCSVSTSIISNKTSKRLETKIVWFSLYIYYLGYLLYNDHTIYYIMYSIRRLISLHTCTNVFRVPFECRWTVWYSMRLQKDQIITKYDSWEHCTCDKYIAVFME